MWTDWIDCGDNAFRFFVENSRPDQVEVMDPYSGGTDAFISEAIRNGGSGWSAVKIDFDIEWFTETNNGEEELIGNIIYKDDDDEGEE